MVITPAYDLIRSLARVARALLSIFFAFSSWSDFRPVLGLAQTTTTPLTVSDTVIATVDGETILASRRRADIRNHLLEAAANGNLLEGRLVSHGSEKPTATVVVFGDYQCAFCRDAHRELASMAGRWPADVRLVFRQFPLPSHPRAMEAAKAAVCASRQHLFFGCIMSGL